jgi:hypothetical protein
VAGCSTTKWALPRAIATSTFPWRTIKKLVSPSLDRPFPQVLQPGDQITALSQGACGPWFAKIRIRTNHGDVTYEASAKQKAAFDAEKKESNEWEAHCAKHPKDKDCVAEDYSV